MKILSQLVARTEMLMYCQSCEKMTSHKIVEAGKNGIKVRCVKCHGEMTVSGENYVQTEDEIPAEYAIGESYKIGQKLRHKIFDDSGDVVGKIRSAIFVNFDRIGVKKLICK